MKHNIILKSLLLALALCLLLGVSVLAAEQEPGLEGYNDIEGTTYEQDIAVMQTIGLTLGYADGSYRPGRAYTRLELAQLAQGLLGDDIPEDFEVPYGDAQDIAGSDAVAAALYHGILTARSEDSFDPYGSVLKAELMAALANIAEALGTEELLSSLEEDLAGWAEDFRYVTAGEAMHAARAMLDALDPLPLEGEASGEPSDEPSEEPSEEPEEDAAGEIIAIDIETDDTNTEIVAIDILTDNSDTPDNEESPETDSAEEVTEEAPEDDSTEDSPADENSDDGNASEPPEEEPAAEASGEPSDEPSAEPSEEPAPAAPQGVLAPVPASTPAAVVPSAPPAAPAAPAAPVASPAPAAPVPVDPNAMPEGTTAPEAPIIAPDDPFGATKSEIYSFYLDLQKQIADFFTGLLA